MAKGVSLEDLWDDLKLETADNFDLGVKYNVNEHLALNPNAFVSVVKNKQARVYDATYQITYPYNGADALGYGLELPVSGAISRDLDYFVSVSYNKYYFTEDLQTASNTIIDSEGNQVPDAPEYMVKAAISYRIYKFEITPSVRYLSKRYGDVLNKEEIDDCTLVDLDVSYTLKNVLFAKTVEFRITATNIFDTEYVSAINTADDALAATNNSATYQTGAPFSIFAQMRFIF